jgi:hypothetical protein
MATPSVTRARASINPFGSPGADSDDQMELKVTVQARFSNDERRAEAHQQFLINMYS